MTTLVAFLRGMNLGGRRITNDDLRAAFVAIGFDDATPYQASGNVIIEAVGRDERELRDVIASGLAGQLGYAVPTFLRSADEIAHIADREPFTAQELAATEGRVQVGLLHAAPSNAARDDMLALATADDRLVMTCTGCHARGSPRRTSI
jgi:uncharacterized protein (DUF1697 family)